MSEIAILRDKDGRVHFTARDSQFARDGLADGSLKDTQEAPDATPDASNGDDLNAGTVDRRSRHRERAARNLDDGDSSGVAEPASGG